MIRSVVAAAALAPLMVLPAVAEDAEAGAAAFKKQCQTCHVVVNEAGETLAGKKAKTGPNLYGVVDAPAGAVEGFRYGKGLLAAAESGLTWDEANFVAYVQNTNDFLREFTGDSKAKSKMAWKVKKEEDAKALYAFLVSLGE